MEASKAANPGDATKLQEATSQVDDKAAAVARDNTDAPDPDEDDLDDLDDMLDDFSNVKINGKNQSEPTAASSGTGMTPTSAAASVETEEADPIPGLDDFSDEDFQKQLQAGMAELMGEMDKSPDMQAQFESIFKGLAAEAGEGAAQGPVAEAAAAAAATANAPNSAGRPQSSDGVDFQETIRRTMERMQNSGDQATAAAAAEPDDDFLAEMMKAMKDMPGAGGEGGEGSEEDFTKMLMGMMEQLTNKEILYEPMRELHEKFPAWMETHRAGLSEEDTRRYAEQQTLVAEMVTKFEEPTYADSNAADREYIVDRMQKMQAAGSPPPDLVGDMPSAKEVLDGPEDSCPTQ